MSLRLACGTARRERCAEGFIMSGVLRPYEINRGAVRGLVSVRALDGVPQYPSIQYRYKTAKTWRRSVVPSACPSPIILFLSCHPAGVILFIPFFFLVAMSRTDVGRIMIKKVRCQHNNLV